MKRGTRCELMVSEYEYDETERVDFVGTTNSVAEINQRQALRRHVWYQCVEQSTGSID